MTERTVDATSATGGATVDGPRGPTASDARYVDVRPLGHGGMGEVRLVRDEVLGRPLAMKIIRWDLADEPAAIARFMREARVTACLQHPGVPPVQDVGRLPDGRLWFTMKVVRGRTLGALIDALHAASTGGVWGQTHDGWTLRRLVDAMLRAAETLAYAHREGVVHRDVKPDNVMVGAFGEVIVVDWGIARIEGGDETLAAGIAAMAGGGPATGVVGTPAYMAPEQARGGRASPASDVYSLGAMLRRLLTGQPPYGRGAPRFAVRAGPPPPLASHQRPDHPPVPAALAELCARSLAHDPAARPADAAAFAAALRGWLDGADRRDRALAIVARARAEHPAVEAARGQAAALHRQAAKHLAGIPAHAPVDVKQPGWALEDRALAEERRAARAELAYETALQAALQVDPELPEAHAHLAEHYAARLIDASAAGDATAVERWQVLLRRHDDGSHADLVAGRAWVSLRTAPTARVVFEPDRAVDRRRVPGDPVELGHTPLDRAPVPCGSGRLRIIAPDRREVVYPVDITRGGHWHGCAPGESDPRIIELPPADALGLDDIYVPAGWTVSGGDPIAVDALPRRRIWVDGFVIRRHPVTHRAFRAFLNALVAAGRRADAERWAPRQPAALVGDRAGAPIYPVDAHGAFGPPPAPDGDDKPVVLVDWWGACAFADHLAAATGLPWRLPTAAEREKASRGVDGRKMPWGDFVEPTWACTVVSRAGSPERAPIDAFPTDESPYGVRGMAGNVRDWCRDAYRRGGPANGSVAAVLPRPTDDGFRSVRGGGWGSAPNACRSAGRFANRPGDRFAQIGLRLVRTWGQPWITPSRR